LKKVIDAAIQSIATLKLQIDQLEKQIPFLKIDELKNILDVAVANLKKAEEEYNFFLFVPKEFDDEILSQ
jgi:hypothetical protein